MKLPKNLPKAVYLVDNDDEICFFAIQPNWEKEYNEQIYTTISGTINSYGYSYWIDEDFPYLVKDENDEISENYEHKSYPFHKDHKRIKDSISINLDKISDNDWKKIANQLEEEYEICVL